jgi:hypothetical protein
MALRTDGTLEAWGNNWAGVVSNTPTGPGFILVCASSGNHALALRSEGSIAAWGQNDGGQVSNAPTGPGYVDLGAGDGHSVALLGHNVGTAFCFGDGAGAPCPYSGQGGPGEGCANTGGLGGAVLAGMGSAYFLLDTFGLEVQGLPGAKLGLCLKGTATLGGGLGLPVGDGLLCVSPQLRSQVVQADGSGQLSLTDWRGQPLGCYPGAANVGAATFYQWWYRDPASTCSGADFNFTNAWRVTWIQ